MFEQMTQFLGGHDSMAMLFLFSVGLLVTNESLQAAFTGYKALYTDSFGRVVPQWPRVAMEAPSNSDGEIYNWLGEVPAMKEWIDSRAVEGLLDFNYTIRNKTWESTIGVKRATFEDDKLGIMNPRFRGLGDEAARHPDELISTIITSNALCYDGQNFFDSDHVSGDSGSQSNITSRTGVTAATVMADFGTARANMINRKNDKGKPFIKNLGQDATGAGAGLWLVMCPPAMLSVFEQLMLSPIIGAETNVLKGAFTLWCNAYLTSADTWYLFYVGSPVRALIFQNRVRPELDQLTNPSASDRVFLQDEYLYGVRARYNAGYGLWQFAEQVDA